MRRCARDWAWNQKLSPTLKLVLVALAEYVSKNDDCWPCEESLGEMTGLPMRAVSKAVRELEASGLILCLRLTLMKEKRKYCGISCFVDWSG
jgi:DNA-binding MarR family transcriptional regulator